METITNLTTNLTTAASRAIFGDGATVDDKTKSNETQGKEPISGELGDVKSGEPYDKGNDETATNNETAGKEPVSGVLGDVKRGEPYDGGNVGTDSTPTEHTSTVTHNPKSTDLSTSTISTLGAIQPENDSKQTGASSLQNPTSATSGLLSSSNDKSDVGTSPLGTTELPSTAQSTQKSTDKTTETPNKNELEMINATNADPIAAVPGAVESGQEGGLSHGSGTGEKYITSTGLKTDGGNFDAANAGAGKDADRLMEKNGVKHEPIVQSHKHSTEGTSAPVEEKKSLKEKIKAKLHKHKD